MHGFENRTFRCDFDMTVPADWVMKLADWFLKKQGSQETVTMDSFEVPEKLYGKTLKQFKKALFEAQEETAKKIKGFHILTMRIQNFRYTKDPFKNEFKVELSIAGDFLTSL